MPSIKQRIRPSIANNIYNLYLIKLSKWFMLIMPIVALYYTENGLESFDIFILQAVYSFSVACMEIPSGYMADVIGRKKSLIMGAFLGTLGFIIYSISSTLNHFLVAEIILGLGGSFISGSDSALLYDSLAAQGNQHKYMQFEGRITSLGSFAETIAALCGGLIAALISYRGVYIGQACIASLAIPASLLLVEPARKNTINRPSIQQIISICYQAVFVNKKLSATILLSSVTGTATLCMAWTSQVYFISHNLTELSITPIWIILNLTAATVAAVAQKTTIFLGTRNALFILILYIPVTYILLGCFPLIAGLTALLLFYAVRGYATPLLKDITNQHCSSDIRATVLSIRSLIIRSSFSIIGPFIGIISDRLSLSHALIITGILLLTFSIPAGLYFFTQLPNTIKDTH